jgi:toxin ParE1/3/4
VSYKLSDRARRELVEIDQYLSAKNLSTADLLMEEFRVLFAMIDANPFLGRSREDLVPGYRSLPIKKYIMFYRVKEDHVEIMEHRSRQPRPQRLSVRSLVPAP